MGMEQPVRVRSLQVTFHPFGTKLAVVDRELQPGFKTDNLIVFSEQLDAALLPAETTMGFDHAIRYDAGIQTLARWIGRVRAESCGDVAGRYGQGCHSGAGQG